MPNNFDDTLITCINSDLRRPYSDWREYHRLNCDCKQEEAIQRINEWAHNHGYRGYYENCHPLCDRVIQVRPIAGAWEFTVLHTFKD